MDKKLFLFDYDHTLVAPEKSAYEILKETIRLSIPNGTTPIPDNAYSELFEKSRGRTEIELARIVATKYYGIAPGKFEGFFRRFVEVRSGLILKTGIIYGEIYDDALCLLRKLQFQSGVIIMLVTGNPREVMNLRINPQLREFFVDKQGNLRGAFGDEGSSRIDLIRLAMEKAMKSEGFNPEDDDLFGFKRNVFYVGDTEEELFAGLEAKVRTVYCPGHDYSGYDLPESTARLLSSRLKLTDETIAEWKTTYGYTEFRDGRGIEEKAIRPTFFATNGLTVPTLSHYLGIPIEPIYSPERRELEKMALERLSAKTGERKEK